MTTKNAILVLGTHRSGTSVTTRVISCLGAQLSPDLLPSKDDNIEGFWEPVNILQLDHEILTDAGLTWYKIDAMAENWWMAPGQDQYRERALNILESDFGKAPLFVIKEPRMCRLVPFWLEALENFGAKSHVVVSLRNPSESAASLRAREGFCNGRGLMLWLRDFLEVERATRGLPRCFFLFADLLSDWRRVATKISQDLGLPWSVDMNVAGEKIDAVISPDYRSFAHDDLKLDRHPDVNVWVLAAYDAAKRLVDAPYDRSAQRELDRIRSEFDPACKAIGSFLGEADRRARREDAKTIADLVVPPANLSASEQSELVQWLGGNFAGIGQQFANIEYLIDRSLYQTRERREYVDQLYGHIHELKQKIAELQTQIKIPILDLDSEAFEALDLASQVKSMKKAVVEKDYHIYQQDLRLDRFKEEAEDLQWQIDDLENQAEGVDGSVRWKLSFPLPSLKGDLKTLDVSIARQSPEADLVSITDEKEAAGYNVVKSWPGHAPYSNAKKWYDADRPEVSIIILNFNKPLLTRACLESLWIHTAGFKYEIVVVDNGSRIGAFNQLHKFPGNFRLIRVQKNRYFGEGSNIGFEASKGEFVVFMNNDVTVTPEWLQPLMSLLTSNDTVGAVAPKFVYPDGRLQEAGALLDEEGVAIQLGKGKTPDDPKFNTTREVTYCSAATILLRHSVFEKVMGFDLIWEPAYYEDTDLCLKIAQIGLKTFYCAESTVIHHENATMSDPSLGLEIHNIIEINREKFLQRWLPVLRGETSSGVLLVPPQKTVVNSALPVAVLHSPYDLTPGDEERYALTMAESLFDHYQVYLMTPVRYSRLRIMTLARELGLDLSPLQICTEQDLDSIRPITLFISVTNDVLPLKPVEGHRNFCHCQFPFPMDKKDADKRKAGKFLEGYDGVLVNSAFTQAHYLAAAKLQGVESPPVHVLNPPVDLVGPLEAPSLLLNKENIILNVGHFFRGGHCKNQDLMIEAFAKLKDRIDTDLELHFVGALHPEAIHRDYYLGLREMAAGLPVFFHLNLDPLRLLELYRRARIYWHATGAKSDIDKAPWELERFGISIVEAMSAGCVPVVYNHGGPTSIVDHDVNGFHWANSEELISETARIFANPQADWVCEMQERALQRAQVFSKQAFVHQFRSLVLEDAAEKIAAQ